MTLGIYGDSFAEDSKEDHLYVKHLNRPCTNYAQGGSALYYSYKRFLETHHLHTQILFVITGPNRVSYNYKHSDVWIHHAMPDYTSATVIDDNSNDKMPAEWEMIRIKHALQQYCELEFLIESEQRRDYNIAMLNHIITTRPDTKFIYAFNDQEYVINSGLQPHQVTPLKSISDLENKKANFVIKGRYIDKRPNHITKASHEILKELVKEFLDSNNTWFDYDINLFNDIKVDINDLRYTDEELKILNDR